jgi:hypothetical protein
VSESLVDDLAAWLANEADLVVGTDLFVGLLPEVPGLVTALLQTGGPARPWSPAETVTVQVLTRGSSLAEVMGRARALYDAIYPTAGGRLPVRNVALSAEWKALAIDAIQAPADLGVGESGKRLVSWNLAVQAVHL